MVSSHDKRLKILIWNSYPIRKTIDIGQRNVVFTRRKMTPLCKIWPNSVAFTFAEPGYDLIHTKNCIPLFMTCPYIITVETFLPRMWPSNALSRAFFEFLRRQLLDKKCARLLAMSEFAIRTMSLQNRDCQDWQTISEKIQLFYPCSDIIKRDPKIFSGDKIKLLAVGHDFMRKGFPAVVRAHERLRRLNLRVETTIVSSLRWSAADFIGPPCQKLFIDEVSRIRNSDINIFPRMENKDVIRLMSECHFLLFPTIHDSFGHVSVEALSVGTPVLVTAQCAQPEIVANNINGFLLPIEVDSVTGRWVYFDRKKDPYYTDAYLDQIEKSAKRIVEIIADFANHVEDYERLSFNAIETVRTKFNRSVQRERLEELYQNIVYRT